MMEKSLEHTERVQNDVQKKPQMGVSPAAGKGNARLNGLLHREYNTEKEVLQ